MYHLDQRPPAGAPQRVGPARIAEDVAAVGNRRVVVRPVRPQDAALHRAFFEGLSPRSRRWRFHAAVKSPTPAMLAAMTQVDHHFHVALATTVVEAGRETLIGEARYVVESDGDGAEFAVAVADDWQRSGLGRALLQRLADAARSAGLKRLFGQVLVDNTPMLQLARRLGFAIGEIVRDGVVAVELVLARRGWRSEAARVTGLDLGAVGTTGATIAAGAAGTAGAAGAGGARAEAASPRAVLRRAERGDVAALRWLHRRALLALGEPHYSRQQLRSYLMHVPTLDLTLIDDATYFVVERGRRLVACGGWSTRPPGCPGASGVGGGGVGIGASARIRAVYTDPDFARQGWARRILQAAEAEIRAAGHREVWLDALLAGVPLYRSCGYEGGELRVEHLPDGQSIPVLPMTRTLPSAPEEWLQKKGYLRVIR